MKLSLLVSSLLVAGAAGFAAASSLQDKEGAAEMMAAPQPTEMHKWLTSHVGDWDAAMSGSMGDSKGSMKIESGPGGLWTLSHYKGDMMGGPFEGREFMGYDPATDTFTVVWIDSWTTTPMVMSGKYDAKTKKMTLKGESQTPAGPMPMSSVTEHPNNDTMVFTMSGGPEGASAAMFKITYTRKQK